MRTLRAWIIRLMSPFGSGRRRRRQIAEELDSLVALHTDANVRAGMPPDEARRHALAALGSPGALTDVYLDRAGIPVAQALADAIREGSRALRRHRSFTATIVAMLALGVGATTALAGLADTLLFRPPAHVIEPDRLVDVNGASNYVLFREVERRSVSLDVAALSTRSLTFGRPGAARSAEVRCVTAGYFRILGADAAAGRLFVATDEVRGGDPLAVLGYGLWKREFGGQPDAIGSTVTFGGRAHRIIGVAPPDFRGLELTRIDAWLLMAVTPSLCSFTGEDLLDDPRGAWLVTVGRLRSRVSRADAEADVRRMALHEIGRPGSQPLRRELDPVLSNRLSRRDGFLALGLAAGAFLMLLIAGANVAGLLSVRALERRNEIAVRVQLGATRLRVFAQLLTENLLLTGVCVAGAWAVAGLITAALRTIFPEVAREAWFDSRGVTALAAFTMGTGLVAGIIPAVQAARARENDLARNRQSLAPRRARWRAALLVTQVALALVLVACAGLFTRSLSQVTSNLGYDVDRILFAHIDLANGPFGPPAEAHRTFDDILARVRLLPGVGAASVTTMSPMGLGFITVMAQPADRAADALTQMAHAVSPDYFSTLGTRIVEGRPFTNVDRPGSPSAIIVDTTLARELWPGEPVIGRCKRLSPLPNLPCHVVVGISEPRRFDSLTEPSGEVFWPLAQRIDLPPQSLLIRADADPDDLAPAVAAVVTNAVPSLAFADVRPLRDLLAAETRSWRLGATLFSLFGGLAVAFAAAGLYSLLAFAVRQRTREIGVRIALGAAPSSVAWLVVGQGGRLVIVGWLIGTGVALAVTRGLESLLYGVRPDDLVSFVAASLVIVTAGIVGAAVPALSAARADPIVALRRD